MTLLPAEFNTVTVHGQYVNLDGTPVTGYLTFAASPLILKAGQSKDLIVPIQIYAGLDTTGSFSIALPATDDPDINPADWTYQVVEGFGSRRTYAISVRLENGNSQNIYDLAPVSPNNGTYYLQGEPGPAGGAMLTTTGQPSASVGVDGDEALDFATGILYRRTGQTWDAGTQLGTPASTPSAMVVRDGSGGAEFAKVTIDQAPVANADATRKDYVDTSLATHAAKTTTHGVAGLLVGTTDTQTLTNKILSAPAVTGGLSTDTLTASGTVTGLQAVVTAAAPTAANQLTRKDYVDSGDATTLASAKSYTDDRTPAASAGTPGTVQLAGDLGGTATAPTVTGGTHHSHTSAQITDATASPTPSTLVLRDASGNTTVSQLSLNIAAPTLAGHAARKDYVDAADALRVQLGGDLGGTVTAPTVTSGTHHSHTSAQVSDATAVATASMVIKRDAAGRASVVDPSAATDIATKNYVDTKAAAVSGAVTSVAGKTGTVTLASADITDATNAATASMLAKRDAAGGAALAYLDRAYSAAPAAPAAGVGRAFLDSTYHGWAQVGSDGSVRYGQAYWGAGTAFPAATYLKAGDTVLRTDIGSNGTVWQYTGNAALGSAGWIPEGPVVCTSTTRPTLALFKGLQITETDTMFVWQWDGASHWLPMTPGACTGKAWYTSGFSGNMTAGTNYAVPFNASRVSGGVTMNSNQMVLPLDGLWDIQIRGYTTGTTGDPTFYARRIRTSVADLSVVTLPYTKENANDRMWTAGDVVPLKAGDQLYQWATTNATGMNYYGNSEYGGVMLRATWVAPLNGATPI